MMGETSFARLYVVSSAYLPVGASWARDLYTCQLWRDKARVPCQHKNDG